MSSKEGDEEKEITIVKRPSAQKFTLNFDNINQKVENNESDEEDSEDPLLQINEYIEKMEDIISEKIVLNPNKKKELNLLLNKLRTTIDGVANTSLNSIGSQSSAFSTSYFIWTQNTSINKNTRKRGKNSHTPRTNQERESSRKKNEIKPIPDFVKNGYDYLSGLDDSEEELKINSSQRKKEILKLIADMDRCFAPDPIKQLSGNQVNLSKYRWTRRTHSDRDLSYVKRRVAMGGDIYDEDDDISEKRERIKKKR